MTKNTIYKCELENGDTAILRSKVLSYESVLQLKADEGKVLTNGTNTSKSVIVPIGEADNYYEIDDEDYDASEIEGDSK